MLSGNPNKACLDAEVYKGNITSVSETTTNYFQHLIR